MTAIQTLVLQGSAEHIVHVSHIFLGLEGMFFFPVDLKISSKYKNLVYKYLNHNDFFVAIIPWCTNCIVITDRIINQLVMGALYWHSYSCDQALALGRFSRGWLFCMPPPPPINLDMHVEVTSCPKHSNYRKHLDIISLQEILLVK